MEVGAWKPREEGMVMEQRKTLNRERSNRKCSKDSERQSE